MNDPHVEALIYRVKHRESTKYVGAPEFELAEFRVKIENDLARFEFREHYATENEAKEVLRPFIERWQFEDALRSPPGDFVLRFEKSEIIDRDPGSGGPLLTRNSGAIASTGFATVSKMMPTVSKQYPPPPSEAAMDVHDPDVQTMLHRYTGYHQGREPLPSMAYFCCEVFTERLSNGAHDVADKHQISHNLIKYVNNLASNKGGTQARHAHAVEHDLTADEVRKLEKAVVAMIIRAAKVAADPNQHMPEINLGNLLEISP